MRNCAKVLMFLTAIALSIGWTGAAPPGTVEAQAQAYLSAYEKLDLAALERLYTQDAIFTDPTSYDQPGFAEPFTFKGKPEVLAGIRSFKTKYGLTRLKYEVKSRFAGPNQMVWIGSVTSVVQSPKGLRASQYPIVTIVTIKGGLVSEHRDYVDYPEGKPVPVPQ
jgi:hypothetical protein